MTYGLLVKLLYMKRKTNASKLEDQFYGLWLSSGGFPLQRQVKIRDIIPEWGKRRHSVDFFSAEHRCVIEIQGGTFQRRRTGHSSGVGIRKDYVKCNLLQLAGFTFVQLDTDLAKNVDSVRQLVLDLTSGQLSLDTASQFLSLI